MKCILCKSDMVKKRTRIDLWVKNNIVVIDGVPASVCSRCGEKVLSPEVTSEVHSLVKHNLRSAKKITVPLMHYHHASI